MFISPLSSAMTHPNADPRSIVLIHGLQGHPFKTWTLDVRGNSKDDLASLEDETTSKFSSNTTKSSSKTSVKLKGIISRLSRGTKSQDVPSADRSRSVFWPRDLLPLQCPESRIMVFGYDTVVAKHQFAGAANKNSIFAHSKNLVNDLCRSRPHDRPIIFLAHSFGGIVVKEVWLILNVFAVCGTPVTLDGD